MKLRHFRRGTQILGLVLAFLGVAGLGMTHLLYPGLHCYACPWAVTVCPIGLMQNLVIAGSVPLYFLGAVALYGLALGRGWCGWFCPFGTVNDLLAFRRRKFLKPLTLFKFVVLGGTLLAAWRWADTWFCKLCPAASLTASLPYLGLGLAQVNTPLLIHMGTLAGTLLGMIFIARFWCRYLCPMGALLALFNRVSLFGLRLKPGKCTTCELCTKACPMGIVPHQDINSTDCIKCGRCVPSCPTGALTVGFSLPGEEGRDPLRVARARPGAHRVPSGQ